MKDIDFDELDRAVSSVLAGSSTAPQSEQQAAPAETGFSVSTPAQELPAAVMPNAPESSQEEVSAPAEPETQSVDTPAEQAIPRATTPLAVKRRGKFMDVVHPSSDMNPAATAVPSAPVVRKTLSPLAAPSLDDQKVDATEKALDAAQDDSAVIPEAAPAATPTPTETFVLDPSEAQSTESKTPDWSSSSEATSQQEAPADLSPLQSDTLDQAEDADGDVSATDEQQAAGVEAGPASLDGFATTSSPVGPLETPFLTDAKVDKRPLGEFGEVSAEEVPEDTAPLEAVGQAETQSDPAAPLPRELQPDVVEVEAIRDDTKEPESVPSASAPVIATVPAADLESEQTHSLFDTSTYHEPIAAAKKSSVPVWVWWVLGLLVCLAAGAGVGYFLFVSGL